ncbi:hypothetical protein [Methylomonas sp. AM2-LC]|uniref:hypothetical protein n=1 Tax=Methylomonas sp. AM2-LC TaxID=3153301 RepID=UPI0032661EE0
MSPSVFVFIALSSEAKPLIQRWGLKQHAETHPFLIYTDSDRVLVITGIGSIAMAGAIGYAMAIYPLRSQHCLMLNLGIAGHRDNALGSIYLVDKIINGENNKKFYPQLPKRIGFKTCAVKTMQKPQNNYAEDCLYDMEAAGFYELCSKFSSSELIHSLKIVSDNSESSIDNINASKVEGWISLHVQAIDELISLIRQRTQQLPTVNQSLFHLLSTQFHFTVSSAVRLKNLLQRWQLLHPDAELEWQKIPARNAKELLNWIEKELDETDFYL